MEAKEIRIGCSFQLENSVLGGGIATIKNKYDLDVAFDLLESNLIKPIPLTEEWLFKFGFKTDILKTKVLYYNTIPYFVLTKGLKRNGYPFHLNGYKNYPRPLHYVHQLQNLYYSLTGKEL